MINTGNFYPIGDTVRVATTFTQPERTMINMAFDTIETALAASYQEYAVEWASATALLATVEGQIARRARMVQGFARGVSGKHPIVARDLLSTDAAYRSAYMIGACLSPPGYQTKFIPENIAALAVSVTEAVAAEQSRCWALAF